MRDRLLIRHFLWRFLEHDLISPNTDRHVVLSALGGALIGVSLFLAILIATPYQFFPLMPAGMVSLHWLDDRFLFISSSMLVMALVAVAQWDALALDARDTLALGVLPIPSAVIVRTKFAAVAVLAIAVAIAWNLPPTLLRFVAVPPGLGVNLRGALTLTVAHAVATVSAGAFGFLAVLGLREGMAAVVGQVRFRRISAGVQAALVVTLMTTLLLLPGAYADGTARARLRRGSVMSYALPPLWFVGLHETLASSVLDRLPGSRPPRVSVAADRDATELYRILRTRFHQLAWTAVAALALVVVVATVASLWNGRRVPLGVGRRTDGETTAGRAWRRAVAHVLARTPLRQAGFFFTLQTLSRQVAHRLAVASSVAVGLSLILITTRGRIWWPGHGVGHIASVPVALLAGQSLLLASVLGGFRRAVRIPADLRASTTFSLAWPGTLTPYLAGVKLAGWFALVLPTLGALFVWHAIIFGTGIAALHLGVGVVVSALLMEMLFVRYRLVPFVSGYVPNGELNTADVIYAAVLLSLSFALAWIERLAVASPAAYLMLVATMIGLMAAVRAFDRASARPAGPFTLDEMPQLPTQRLDLAN